MIHYCNELSCCCDDLIGPEKVGRCNLSGPEKVGGCAAIGSEVGLSVKCG